MSGTFAVVTGGGTAGHVIPALAVAEALVAAGHRAEEIHYVGARRGVEVEMVPPTGLGFTFLDVIGLQRRMSRRNLAFVPRLIRACRHAVGLLARLEPQVVVNLGGYASFPATFAAWRLGIPYVVVSYDRRPGLVSRLVARRAAACAVAFETSDLPRSEYTGAPVRREIVDVDRATGRAAARAALELPDERFVVAVVCGSLGAGTVNAVVDEVVDRLAERRDLAVYHVVGARFRPAAAPERDGSSGILYRVIGFEARMPLVYAAADLLVTRAGAGTIAELAAVGAPAIVVPWPGAAANHQLDNAQVLSSVGAAILLEEADLTADRLTAEITSLVADPARLSAIASRAREAGTVHRSRRLVTLVERVAAR